MARFLLAKVMDQFSEKTFHARVYINSLGGDVHQSIAIYDVIKVLLPDVCTIAMGLAASGASLILAGGTIHKNISFFY
jgi:ATP-dependent Clp protease protease subunit